MKDFTHSTYGILYRLSTLPAHTINSVAPKLSIKRSDFLGILSSLKNKYSFEQDRIVKQYRNCNSISKCLVGLSQEKLFRRGRRISDSAFERRASFLSNEMKNGVEINWSLLLLPNKDKNILKHDGYLPDLGEITALLRVWSLASSMNQLKENIINKACVILSNVMGVSIIPINLEEHFESIISKDNVPNKSILNHGEILKEIRGKIKKSHAKELISSINSSGISFKRENHASQLVIFLTKNDFSFSDFMESVYCSKSKIRMNIVRDPARYACFLDDPKNEYIQYGESLQAISRYLNMNDCITITSHEELEQKQDASELGKFKRKRDGEFNRIRDALVSSFRVSLEELRGTDSRENFFGLLESDINSNTCPSTLALQKLCLNLFEPVMFGKNWLEKYPKICFRRSDYLDTFSRIYEPFDNLETEEIRVDILQNSLLGAIEYVASYSSNTAAMNNIGIDDMKFLMPDSYRASIHAKPEHLDQPTITVGPSLNRTPWHGSSFVTISEKSIRHETKMSVEAVTDAYSGIILKGGDEDSVSNNTGISTYMELLEKSQQPIFFIRDDTGSHIDLSLINKAVQKIL